MAMIRDDELMKWNEREVVDPSGDKIGTADGLYDDEATGLPEWLLVNTGMRRMKRTFVPAGRGAFFSKRRTKTTFRREGATLTAWCR